MKTELKIEGMSCGHCVRSVKEALESVSGVRSAEVNLEQKHATVEGDAESAALIHAVEEEGYKAQVA